MKYCENCKKSYADDQSFCSVCGSRLIEEPVTNTGANKICSYCGSQNLPHHAFCSTCGNKFIEPSADSNAVCSNCGTQNPAAHTFCSACGHRLDNYAPHAQQQMGGGAPYNSTSYMGGAPQTGGGTVVTFKRPQVFQWATNLFHIKIDNATSYELKNGSEISIPLTSGYHSVGISVFGFPRKKQFQILVSDNMTFICKPNFNATLTFLAAPVKVTDINGKEY